MFTVYAIFNKNSDKIYIGYTEDIKKRIEQHNSKDLKKSFTSRFEGAWIVFYSENVANKDEAIKREKQLKSFRGREFLRKHIPG